MRFGGGAVVIWSLGTLSNDDDDGSETVAKKMNLRPFKRGDEWSLRAFASMPSTAIFLRARAEIKNFLCELASNAKIWGARASEHSFKFCQQIERR